MVLRFLTKNIEYIIYIACLFIVVPIKYNGNKQSEFEQYLKDFNKSYTNATLYQLRLSAFQNSLNSIEQLNKNRSGARYGLTKFSDMSPEEFLNNHLSQITTKLQTSAKPMRFARDLKSNKLPQKIDWREKLVVSALKNQKNCGACWAFSSIETIETMNALKTGKLVELSVQQMIDCADGNNGCFGGDICVLLNWLKARQIAIRTEVDYPLKLSNNQCKYGNISGDGVKLSDYSCQYLVDSETEILRLLAVNGPIAVAVNAKSWQNYVGGTIQFHCDGNASLLNHAVQIVGYDLTADVPFYIARNTWGDDFGEKGYLKLAIGKNICGLATKVSAMKVV